MYHHERQDRRVLYISQVVFLGATAVGGESECCVCTEWEVKETGLFGWDEGLLPKAESSIDCISTVFRFQ